MLDKSFTSTEIGELPTNWEVVRVGDAFEVQQGKALSPGARRGRSPRPFLRTANVFWGRLDLTQLDQMDFTAEETARLALHPGDLLACEGGEIGRTAVWTDEIEGCLYQNHIHRLRRKRTDVAPHFVMYWMQAAFLHLRLYGGVGNKTTIPNLSGTRLKQLPIPLPPVGEQRAIAGVLAKIQAAVEVQDKIVTALKELKAATMAKLFREGLVRGFMFDSNIFDEILDGGIEPSQFSSGCRFFVTHIQRNEIERCPKPERRGRLLQLFGSLPQEAIPTESAVWDVSRWGQAKWGGSPLFNKLRKDNPKHTEDALIAETCIKQNLVLVTQEKGLQKWVRKAGGEAIPVKDLLAGRWRPLKQTEIGEIPESWEVAKVGDLFAVELGKMLSPKSRRGIKPRPYLRNKNVQWGRFDLSDVFQMDFTDDEFERFRLKSGDILVCEGGEPGRTAVWGGEIPDCCYQKALHRLRPKNDKHVLSRYYLYWATAAFTIFRTHKPTGTKTTIAHLPKEKLEVLEMALPELSEQERIVETLDGLDKRLLLAETRASGLKALFSSMLHRLMTGQVRVTRKMIALQALEARRKQRPKRSGKVDEKILQEVVKRTVEAVAPEKIILFGSAARGEMGPDSDLDLLVVKACEDRREVAQTIRRQLIGIGVPKDVVVVTPEDVEEFKDIPGYIIGPALKEGKVLYAA